MFPDFQCPVCHLPLAYASKTYRCENNHCFDEAKAGYVNLLLPQHKRSRNPGDNDKMIKSRQHFLNAGYYQPLASALGILIRQFKAETLLDMGCGEGYYLNSLNIPDLKCSGIDIAKTAVHLAAKRQFKAQLAVGSAYQLPFAKHSFDVALSVFSPLSPEEALRVLKPKGHLVMVGPGPDHLRGLMAHIYETLQPHQGNDTLKNSPLFECVETQAIKQDITVKGEDIFNLLTMTPYYWKCTAEQQETFKQMKTLKTPIHFQINTYRAS